jgi:hypothetical protein
MHGLKCIFFYVPLPPSGVLQLVETLEEEVLVLRDGHPFGTYRWPAEQITDAVDTFRRIAAGLQREALHGDLLSRSTHADPGDEAETSVESHSGHAHGIPG